MSDRATYAAKMQRFFTLYDHWEPRGPETIYLGGDWRNDGDTATSSSSGRPRRSGKHVAKPPDELAIRYARFFWTGGRNGEVVGLPPSDSVNNLSIAYYGHDLASLTRRIQAISDTSMFTHFRQYVRHEFDTFVDSTTPQPGAPTIDQKSFVRCDDLAELGRWLLDCRPLLEAGDVFYYPDIVTNADKTYTDGYGNVRKERELSIANLTDVILANGKLIEQTTAIGIGKSRIVYPILRVDLPFIDETSMATFASMALDHRPALERARDSLRAKLLELEGVMGEEKLETAIIKTSVELRDSIREIDSAYNAFKRGSAFGISGASLGTVSATLALSATFAEAAGLVGAGGGLIALAKAVETHFENRAQVRERDLYFFWLLERNRQKGWNSASRWHRMTRTSRSDGTGRHRAGR